MDPNDKQFLSDTKEVQELFDISATDHEITSVLRNRIAKSESFFEKKPYNLTQSRKNNHEILFGDHYKAGQYPTLYDSSIKYTEPQVYVGVQTTIAYITSRLHSVDARAWNNTPAGRLIARDFAKYADAHGTEHDLIGKVSRMLYDLYEKKVGVLKFVVDPDYKGIGEIIPHHVDPNKIVFDHTAGIDDNPGFIAEKVNTTIQDLIKRFPKKKDEIFDHFRIKQGTPKQLASRCDYFEVWVTGSDKDGNPEEQYVCFLGGLVLTKKRNPHWNYDIEDEEIGNYLPMPPKPYLSINLINDGSSKIDQISPIELVAPLQHTLNRRMRTIAEHAERYAGLKVFSGEAIDKDDVEELSGEPDESVVVDAEDVRAAVNKIAPDYLPQFVYDNAIDIRNTIHTILGTPPELRGDNSDTETLGEAIMARDQAEGRMETIVRALDAFMDKYFKYLLHFMKVYYTEEHWQAIAGENGTYEYIMMQRDRLKDGIDVYARSGSSKPFDKARVTNTAIKLAEMDRLDTLSLYEMLEIEKPEEKYERLIKSQVDPTLLVKDIKEDDGERTANMDYEVIMAGKYAPPRENPAPNHINTHKMQMVSDEFVNGTDENGKVVWTPEKKEAFKRHVEAEIESLRRRAIAMEDELAATQEANTSPMVPGNEDNLPLPPPEDGTLPQPPSGGLPPQPPAPASGSPNVAPSAGNPSPLLPPA